MQELQTENEEKFVEFLGRGKSPYDYEKRLLEENWERVFAVLNGINIPPYELEIQPSSNCDAHCNFCFARNSQRLENKLDDPKAMETVCEEIDKLDKFGKERTGFGIDTIKFCGSTGEPFTNPYTLDAIDFFKKRGKKVRAFTNGLKISRNLNKPEYIETLGNLDSLNISLDAGSTKTFWKIKPGARKKRIDLEDVLAIVPKLKRHGGPHIAISYVITKDNYHEISLATKKAKYAGADLIRFRINMTDRNVSEEHGEEIVEQLDKAEQEEEDDFKVIRIHSDDEVKETKQERFSSKGKYKCFTSRFWACVGANGKVYPCGHVAVNGTRNYGSLLEDPFLYVASSNRRERTINELPGKNCYTCSPFSIRTNEFMSFLSTIPQDELKYLIKKYITNGK